MEKMVYLIVKSHYDRTGNLIDVTPVVVYSSKSMAENSLPGYKKVEDIYRGFSEQSVIYELKEVEII